MTTKVHISKMSGKLNGLRSISTNTMTNLYCIKMNQAKDGICTKCYSHYMLKTYRKNCQPAFQRNSNLLSTKIIHMNDLPIITDEYFRFNAHGELINETHLVNLIRIAVKNPGTMFALWTKRKDLIKKWDKAQKGDWPKNLNRIYSNPKIADILESPPQGFQKVFNNVPEDMEPERQNCTGQKCIDCLLCYKYNSGVDTIIEKVKNYG